MAIEFATVEPNAPSKRLVQCHWQNPADPSDTVLVAQAEHSRHDEMMGWAMGEFGRRTDLRPPGWVAMICREGSPFFRPAAE